MAEMEWKNNIKGKLSSEVTKMPAINMLCSFSIVAVLVALDCTTMNAKKVNSVLLFVGTLKLCENNEILPIKLQLCNGHAKKFIKV